jgi:hypothetical protein
VLDWDKLLVDLLGRSAVPLLRLARDCRGAAQRLHMSRPDLPGLLSIRERLTRCGVPISHIRTTSEGVDGAAAIALDIPPPAFLAVGFFTALLVAIAQQTIP